MDKSTRQSNILVTTFFIIMLTIAFLVS